jgi:hypothetical protein
VTVAAVLDVGVGTDGVRPRVALVRVLKVDLVLGVRGTHHVVGDAVRVLGIVRRPEVGVEALIASAHGADPLLAAFVNAQLGDIRVPDVVLREDLAVRSGSGNGTGPDREKDPGAHDECENESKDAHVLIIGVSIPLC